MCECVHANATSNSKFKSCFKFEVLPTLTSPPLWHHGGGRQAVVLRCGEHHPSIQYIHTTHPPPSRYCTPGEGINASSASLSGLTGGER